MQGISPSHGQCHGHPSGVKASLKAGADVGGVWLTMSLRRGASPSTLLLAAKLSVA